MGWTARWYATQLSFPRAIGVGGAGEGPVYRFGKGRDVADWHHRMLACIGDDVAQIGRAIGDDKLAAAGERLDRGGGEAFPAGGLEQDF